MGWNLEFAEVGNFTAAVKAVYSAMPHITHVLGSSQCFAHNLQTENTWSGFGRSTTWLLLWFKKSTCHVLKNNPFFNTHGPGKYLSKLTPSQNVYRLIPTIFGIWFTQTVQIHTLLLKVDEYGYLLSLFVCIVHSPFENGDCPQPSQVIRGACSLRSLLR